MFVKIIILNLIVLTTCLELEINDLCVIQETGQNGICLLDINCEIIFKSYRAKTGPKPEICGFQGLSSIVCCPEEHFTNQRSSKMMTLPLIEKRECTVQTTGENGVYKILEHCNTLTQQERSAKSRTKICEDPICSDLICCPIRNLHKKKRSINL